MTTHDFSDLTPPDDLVDRWRQDFAGFQHAARWGAEQAAKRLAGQWPEPITDRPPTEADGDDDDRVQILNPDGTWDEIRTCHWQYVARDGDPWTHTPRWQPPAPPSLTEQALADINAVLTDTSIAVWKTSVLDAMQNARRALEADS